jgi:hypothetical protein
MAALSKSAFEPSKSKSVVGTRMSPTLTSRVALLPPRRPPPRLFVLGATSALAVELRKSPSARSTVSSDAAAVCTEPLPFKLAERCPSLPPERVGPGAAG